MNHNIENVFLNNFNFLETYSNNQFCQKIAKIAILTYMLICLSTFNSKMYKINIIKKSNRRVIHSYTTIMLYNIPDANQSEINNKNTFKKSSFLILESIIFFVHMHTDSQIRDIVDELFRKYDKDHSNSIDETEIAPFLNEIFGKVNYPMHLSSRAQAIQLLRYLDINHDGELSKMEIFNVVKYLVNSASQMNNPKPTNTYFQEKPIQQQIQNPYLNDYPSYTGNLQIHNEPNNPYGFLQTDIIPPYLQQRQTNFQQQQLPGGNIYSNMPNNGVQGNIGANMNESFCWNTLMKSQKKMG